MKTNNTPKIRFPNFTHAWEKCRLGDVAHFKKGSGYSKKDLTQTGTPVILYGRLYTDYKTSIDNIDTFAREKNGCVLSVGGEVITPASGESADEIACASVVERAGVILGGDLNIIKLNEKIFPIFLALLISNGRPKLDLIKKAQGKSVVHIKNSDLASLVISFPSLPEQKRIGEFFKSLDSLITLHKRKLDNIKELKKSLLQNMFVKDNQTTPKIRFPNFTHAWEKCKLGDVAEIIMGQSPKSEFYTNNPNDYILVQGNADIKNGWVSPRVWTTQITKKGSKGDIIFSVRAPVGEVGKTDYDVVLGRGVAAIKGNEFIFQALNKMNIFYFWKSLSSGTTFDSISSNELRGVEILIPDLSEQKRIGEFFKKLDELIALNKRQEQNLLNLKKSLLQKMFV